MNICSNKHFGLAAFLLGSSLLVACGEEPVRSRGAVVDFSAPKSDVVSTNLNELRKPISPFQELESNLKSPFESLEKPRKGPDFRESRRLIQQQQRLNQKTLKESLNERAEQMFLNPEQFEGENSDEAFFQLSKDSLDPYQKKPKNSLERYNDRQERDRLVLTNRAAIKKPFDDKNLDRPDDWKSDSKAAGLLKPDSYADQDRNNAFSLFPRTATNSSSLSSDFGTAARPEMFDRAMNDSIARQRANTEARMEDFKRLLEGPRYTQPTATTAQSSFATPAPNYGLPAANSTATASRAVVAPSTIPDWSPFKSSAKGETKDDFATSAGLVGALEKPQGLPEFPSATRTLAPLTTPAPELTPATKFPSTTFKIPQRRF